MTNTTTKKEKKHCWFGLYILADRALLPTCIKTSQGDFDVEPIRELNYRSRSELLDALSEAIQKGNPPSDVPPLENRKKQTPLEKLAKAKSWADLERKSIYFSIKVFPSCFSVKAWGRAPDSTWSDENDTSFDARIPIEAGVEGIADAILDHLKTRSDLPGPMSA